MTSGSQKAVELRLPECTAGLCQLQIFNAWTPAFDEKLNFQIKAIDKTRRPVYYKEVESGEAAARELNLTEEGETDMHQPVFANKSLEQFTGMCLLSAAVLTTYQILHQVSLLLLKALWSDEGKAILGSSVFYPTAAMTVLFIVAQMVPARVVKYCSGFCKRKALAAWNRIRKALAKQATAAAKFATKRSRVIASLRIMLGAIEMFCL